MFEKQINAVSQGSSRVVASVMDEFKVKYYKDVAREDRKTFLNMIKRRMPGKRDGHITRKRSRLEQYGYSYPGYREKAGIIKGVADIVKVE